jgi:hypothetical protein
VNVVVAAARADHVHHAIARDWLEGALDDAARSTATFRLQPMVLASVLRLLTSARVFAEPTPLADTLRFLDAMLARPGVEVPAVGCEWPALRRLCDDHSLTGNAIPDAWLAAAVLSQGEHLVTFDSRFERLLPPARFARLKATSR